MTTQSAGDLPRSRPDPVRDAVPGQELVYGSIQSLWSAWARRRYGRDFEAVSTFCLFVGYPRSGHSLVGAMLNAHRHAVISHELDVLRLIVAGCDRAVLFSRILARAAWFNLKRNTSNYRYDIPNRWQGRFEELRVVGDKGGGWVAQWLQRHPDLLDRTRATVRVPLRLIHVVRNPFDNIGSISVWHRMSVDESIEFYFSHCATTGALCAQVDGPDILTVRHEDFIAAPAPTLSSVCLFLGLEPDAKYLERCSSIVFGRPTRTRERVAWSAAQVLEVERRAAAYPFLSGYEFDRGPEAARTATVTSSALPQSTASRIAAFLNPRVRR